jgi:2-keto-4-pentenoate hydratase/2-oxohepta-3-ene-1,7-dioic acid hydratase in catechol pathway
VKIVRFETDKKAIHYGILEGDQVAVIKDSIYTSIEKTGETFAADAVKLLAPCQPGKIFCVGLNFRDHIEELEMDIPVKPANFLKPNSSIAATEEAIEIPTHVEQVDYEGELAIVIKDKIKYVTPEEAKKHILGVTPLNDVTERVLSFTPSLVTYCKAFDTFTPFGPVIDTDIDPDAAIVRTYLNGQKVQEGDTSTMIFKPSEIVSFLSQGMTLYPGDVISTGTPSGVQAMKDGDRVEIEIVGIDQRLVNVVVDTRK